MLLLKVVILLWSFVDSQSISTRRANELRKKLQHLYESTQNVMLEGTDVLNPLLDDVHTYTVEKGVEGREFIEILYKQTITQVNTFENQSKGKGIDIAKCCQAVRKLLKMEMKHSTALVDQCISQSRRTSINNSPKLNEISKHQFFIIRDDYNKHMTTCIKDNDEKCLNNIFEGINNDIQQYRSELTRLFNVAIKSITNQKDQFTTCIEDMKNNTDSRSQQIFNRVMSC
ncbi:PREDICTED: uncharacterized protein LOC108562965 [Nicrophorus vespilloides]|uniref:Uncharacterized protein LOC108562965 n=1 Tax=Nicrophorus vespilloides TaxID=110193 RepID=A0ABM1MQW7_NICVS|nr:PREDICTED: uncharacterized protein LOC108562965 [Nicrophorus vespilloides]